MGYAVSWLAIRGHAETSVLAALALEKTGETEEIAESDWSATRVGEWLVIWSNSCQPKRFRDAGSKLPGEVVICDVEEHVMFSSVASFNDGTLGWRITHDAQESSDHLVVEGQPPASFAHIQAEQSARAGEDREVDFIFDIPVRMAEEIVGFRHDGVSSSAFEVLRVTPESKRKWKLW